VTARLITAGRAGERWRVTEMPSTLTMHERLMQDVREGLHADPPSLPPRWFYDEKGSRLFDEITRLPEYYPTRRETEILAEHALEIALSAHPSTLVELGSGTSTKTRILLTVLTRFRPALRFVPIDVSVEVLTEAAADIAALYPGIEVDALATDFADPLPPLPGGDDKRLVAFLGGTIGNFDDEERHAFLGRLRDAMNVGDRLLLGADLIKDPGRLVRAYDDSKGVTAEFNRNVIEVLRRELGAHGLDARDFAHVARWNAGRSRIEMWLRATRDVSATFDAIDMVCNLPAGGELLTEISVKFRLSQLHDELRAAGFGIESFWTDSVSDFSLSLAVAA